MLREFDAHTTNAKVNPPPVRALFQTSLEGLESDVDSGLVNPGAVSPGPVKTPDAPQELRATPVAATGGDRPPGLGAIFYNRNFLTLWLGQLLSQLADKIYLVLIIAIISTRFETPGQTISSWVAAVMIAFTVPAVLFGAVAGVFVDRWPKKPILVLSNLLRGGLVMLLPLGLWLTGSWGNLGGWPLAFELLLGVTFLVSTLTQFFAPAEQAMIPVIVQETDLLSANSLYTTTMMASVIIGFAVGEPVIALADHLMSSLGFTHHGPALLVGLSYVLAGLCLLLLAPGREVLARNRELAEVWTDIREGLAYLRDHAQVRVAIVQLVLLSCVFAALAVLAVRLAEMIPALKASQFGFLLAAGGLGLTLGALWVGHFGQRFLRRFLSLWGTLGMALCLVALAWTTQQLWLSIALIATLGLCGAFVGIPMQTLIQETTPEAMRGKVFGLQNNLVNIALTLPLALASVLETQVGLGNVFIGLGVLVGVGGVVTWYIADTALR
ncbi:MAG TPA: MFS transporter [Leptolyngbyaceae cyanobacterium M65_K2018_010]|nr:MFS transporter [Leptolyngbyaceae cyanobacterium M65_K2018_010]